MLEFSARTNLRLKVTHRQMEIIVGCLLGDGYIHPRGQIQIEQSAEQLPYINWKYDELCSIAYGPPTKVERFDNRYGKKYIGARFWLRQYFRPLRKIFYPEGRKIFPMKMSKYFTDLSLAVWYMDDGNLYKGRHLKIACDGFDSKTRKLLQSLLLNKYSLKSSVHKSGKLRISAESLSEFFRLVRPHIYSSMMYKVP